LNQESPGLSCGYLLTAKVDWGNEHINYGCRTET
jgi:hypothetical protein